MAIKYEVKRVVFGFDESKTEKFVAQTSVGHGRIQETLRGSTEGEYGSAWCGEDGD